MGKTFSWMCGLLLAAAAVAAEPVFHQDRLEQMREQVLQTISRGVIPGAVIRLERLGTVHEEALGKRSLLPSEEENQADTIYDLASLTKVMTAAPAVMTLVDAGKIDLEKTVQTYLPEFTGAGKEAITVRQLLTHTSGLRAGLSPDPPWNGSEAAFARACAEPLPNPPGTILRYSDINFILLGLLVEKVSGRPLDEYCDEVLFRPLSLKDTGYRRISGNPGNPERVAPTERLAEGSILRGIVHDPTARRMDGVAGHAGLFSTAADVARFAKMIQSGGELDGVRVLTEESVKRMITVQTPPDLPRRGLGWDIDSPFTGQRGLHFPIGGYGHTGWTGPSMWIDPYSGTSLVFLTNRNHPKGGTNVLPLRRDLGTLAAEAVAGFNFLHVPDALPARDDGAKVGAPRKLDVLNGIDVLERENFARIKGLKIGLVTNPTGQNRIRKSTIDLLHGAEGVELVALFSPEHGIRADLDQEKIGDTKDEGTGLPIYSLYGERRTPSAEQLKDLDVLVYDIQDVGCRFYTYISTLVNCMEAAAENGVKVMVLDRVNPIGGGVEGPVLTEKRSFVAVHEIPVRHGMTLGELARMIRGERNMDVELEVVECAGGGIEWFDETGLPWQNPSPNLRGVTAAALYPGVGLLEFCKVSVGRGTGTPFEILGAPYIDDMWLAGEMNRAGLPGIRFVPVRFTPISSVFAGEECRGVQMILTDRDAFRPVDLGIVLAATLNGKYSGNLELGKMLTLLGDRPTLEAIRAGKPLPEIKASWEAGLREFENRRRDHLLYPR